MSAMAKLTVQEGRLFVREPIALLFGLLLPMVLLLALGFLFPGFTDPAPELDGDRFIDIYAPIALALGTATLGLATMPSMLASYRQLGILRRLRTTPMHPARLLGAQLAVNLVVAIVAGGMAVVSAVIAFDLPIPENLLWFAVAFLVMASSMLSFGLLVGAFASTASSGTAIGMALYFPMLFFAGVWIPRGIMPDWLLTASDLTPLGSSVQALQDSWFGSGPAAINLVVPIVYTVVIGFIAVRAFRWD